MTRCLPSAQRMAGAHESVVQSCYVYVGAGAFPRVFARVRPGGGAVRCRTSPERDVPQLRSRIKHTAVSARHPNDALRLSPLEQRGSGEHLTERVSDSYLPPFQLASTRHTTRGATAPAAAPAPLCSDHESCSRPPRMMHHLDRILGRGERGASAPQTNVAHISHMARPGHRVSR